MSGIQAWADLEHLAATDSFGKQHAAMLSAPTPVMSFDFSSLTALPPASRSVALDVPATTPGVLNCVTFWWVLNVPGMARMRRHSRHSEWGPAASRAEWGENVPGMARGTLSFAPPARPCGRYELDLGEDVPTIARPCGRYELDLGEDMPTIARPCGRYELDLGEGMPTIALGPDWTAPRCSETRARRQQLRYLNYERAIVEGERVRACTACHSWTRFVTDRQ